jgi:hypothetical protein
MTIRVRGEPEIESRPGQPGTGGAPRGGIESPAGGAGGAQFDVYDSMSKNTRIASAAKLSESTRIRRAVPGAPLRPATGQRSCGGIFELCI